MLNNQRDFFYLPSGKRLHNYGKSPFLMGTSTISMAIFNSNLLVYQRVDEWSTLRNSDDCGRLWPTVAGLTWAPNSRVRGQQVIPTTWSWKPQKWCARGGNSHTGGHRPTKSRMVEDQSNNSDMILVTI